MMIAVLSPAKSLDFTPPPAGVPSTVPEFMAESEELIGTLRRLSRKQLAKLMDLSDSLAALNYERFQAWSPEVSAANAKQALLAFDGDVYQGFALDDYTRPDFTFAQKHLRILSGLHGVLRPLDLIQPYRLEMGRSLKTRRGPDLYAFWGSKITDTLNAALDPDRSGVLINLASQEYFAAVDPAHLRGRVLSCVFKDEKLGQFKILSFFAKRARGMMADFIIRERVTTPSGLKDFTAAGYQYDPGSSTPDQLVFLRPEKAAA